MSVCILQGEGLEIVGRNTYRIQYAPHRKGCTGSVEAIHRRIDFLRQGWLGVRLADVNGALGEIDPCAAHRSERHTQRQRGRLATAHGYTNKLLSYSQPFMPSVSSLSQP